MNLSKKNFRVLQRELCFILLFFSIAVHAAATPSLEDSIPILPRKKNVGEILMNWVDIFNRCDTVYIRPHRYNYALLTTYSTHLEQYGLYSEENSKQTLVLSPAPQRKIGLYFGWKFLFLGWSVDVDKLGFSGKRRNRGTTIDLSFYSSRIGLDLLYHRTSNTYRIHRITGFSPSTSSASLPLFDGLDTDIRGFYLYYIFNSQRFSYPAAYSQTTNQRRSAGSWMMGVAHSSHRLFFDENRFPESIQQEMSPSMRVTKVAYATTSLYVGYGYNWVVGQNLLVNLTLNPAIAYKRSSADAESSLGTPTTRKQHQWGVDFLGRAGLVYNNGRYFIGSSFVTKVFNYRRNSFFLSNSLGTLQVYAGFNFDLKKEYRKHP